jgi:hypothetical protein
MSAKRVRYPHTPACVANIHLRHSFEAIQSSTFLSAENDHFYFVQRALKSEQ